MPLRNNIKASKLIKCPVRKRERFRLSAKLSVDVIEGLVISFTRACKHREGDKRASRVEVGFRHAKIDNGRLVVL